MTGNSNRNSNHLVWIPAFVGMMSNSNSNSNSTVLAWLPAFAEMTGNG